jgi:cell wall assembly regulator SMI1
MVNMEKYFDFEFNNRVFEKYKMFVSNIDERMNKCESTENIKVIEKLIEHKLPKTFVDFYSKFDGEKDSSYLGMIIGLSLMSTEDILKTIHDFSNMDFEIMSMNTGIIKDDVISNRILIPFAFDGSRCYIALDMSPDKNGKEGQVITIDLDYDKSYLLAYSLDEFYSFILKMFDSKNSLLRWGKMRNTILNLNPVIFLIIWMIFLMTVKIILKKFNWLMNFGNNIIMTYQRMIRYIDIFWKRRRGFLSKRKNFHLNLLCI